jgi:hypothetical protein
MALTRAIAAGQVKADEPANERARIGWVSGR